MHLGAMDYSGLFSKPGSDQFRMKSSDPLIKLLPVKISTGSGIKLKKVQQEMGKGRDRKKFQSRDPFSVLVPLSPGTNRFKFHFEGFELFWGRKIANFLS